MSTARDNPQHGRPPASDVAHEVSTWAVGGGIVVTALFPLAIPILALTAVAVLPLLLPLVAVGLAVALLALPVLAVRVAGRWRRRALGRTTAAEHAPSQEYYPPYPGSMDAYPDRVNEPSAEKVTPE